MLRRILKAFSFNGSSYKSQAYSRLHCKFQVFLQQKQMEWIGHVDSNPMLLLWDHKMKNLRSWLCVSLNNFLYCILVRVYLLAISWLWTLLIVGATKTTATNRAWHLNIKAAPSVCCLMHPRLRSSHLHTISTSPGSFALVWSVGVDEIRRHPEDVIWVHMAQWFPPQVTGQVGGKARCLGNSTQCQVCWFSIHQLGWNSLVCGGNDDLPDYQPRLCQLCVKSSWCLEKTWLS